MKRLSMLIALCAVAFAAVAQLSTNPDKFLGNITTRGQINYNGVEFTTLWNQLTPENESKWESIEGQARGQFNWWSCDQIYDYCKTNGIPFKFHCLVWGSQYPRWMDNLSTDKQYAAIVEWMDAVAERYPDIEMIDVVNEAIVGHAPAPYKQALGGDGITGYDWIIKAFQMARERWPQAILIYNDYNTFEWQKAEFIDLVKTLRDAGAPIDAYGCQSHDLTDINFNTFKNSMAEIQNALQMPMYSTEYDIGTDDDQKQYNQYSKQIPYMWEQPYVAGITLWGYVYGATWTTNGNSGIIKNGVDRPAMTWLREYMASDEARQAVSPFPAGKMPAQIYVRPSRYVTEIDLPLTITVDATVRNADIDHVDLYIANELAATMTAAPYEWEYTPHSLGNTAIKAVVTDAEGNTYERVGGLKVHAAQTPYGGAMATMPGWFEAEDFDLGGEGVAWHDTDRNDEGGAGYRTDNQGVDIGLGSTGYVIGYTATGEWLEYTVDVTEEGICEYDAVVSSGTNGSAFSLSLVTDTGVTPLTGRINVPNTGSWDTYRTINGKLTAPLPTGKQTLRITIEGSYCNIDRLYLGTAGSGIEDVATQAGPYDVYTSTGIYLGRIDRTSDLDQVAPSRGVYILSSPAGSLKVAK